MYMHTTLN